MSFIKYVNQNGTYYSKSTNNDELRKRNTVKTYLNTTVFIILKQNLYLTKESHLENEVMPNSTDY